MMMETVRIKKSVITFYICCALFISMVQSLAIHLAPGDMRCIGQELDQLDYVVFALSATSKVKDSSQRVFVTITNPEDETIHDDKLSIGAKRKEVEIKVQKVGMHEMCFELNGGKTPVRILFHIEYRPRSDSGEELARKVGKEDIPTLDSELQFIEKSIKDISKVIEHAKAQEISMKDTVELTSSRIQWFSTLSIVILLGTSIWQIIYLRSFFASKKLL